MRRAHVLLAATVALVSLGCQDSLWFKGDFAAGQAAAEERNTLIMMDFYTDW